MRRIATIALTFAVAYGCSSDKGLGPSLPKEQVSLAFCPIFGPTWLAIQNEAEGWQAVTINQIGPTTFEATQKVSVAFVIDFFGSSFTAVLNVSREELQGTPGFTCFDDELLGDEGLSGTVAGLTGSQSALIVGGQSLTYVDASFPDWTLESLQATPVDVVGLRFPTPSTQPPDRIVVRRNQMPTTSAPITLEFEGAGSTLENATVTFGNPASDFINMAVDFVTANQTFVDLMYMTTFDGTLAFNYVSVPASLRIDSDMHIINAVTTSDYGVREITHFYKAPANKTLNFGPAMNLPTVNTVSATPVRRLNATIESQAEYATAVQMDYDQEVAAGVSKAVTIVTTAAFLGGPPTTWQLVIPDMTSAGYQAEWGLTSGGTTFWSVTGYGGDLAVLLGGTPADGATLTSATERNPISITKTAAHGARRQPAVRGLRRFITR